MKKSFLGALTICFACMLVYADVVKLNPDHPDVHHVVKGDTLWDISSAFLADPWLWPEIWHVNPQIENPHLIYPGDEIKLVYHKGEMRNLQGDVVEVDGPVLTMTRGQNGVIKLSPAARVSPLSTAVPAISLDKIKGFLSNNRVVTKAELQGAPYVIAGNELHLIMGQGDKFYARGDWSEPADAYGIYREGDPYIDPDTQEILGYNAQSIGLAKMLATEPDNDISTLRLVRQTEEVRIKDRLLETQERDIESVFYPKAPKEDVRGKIITVFSGVKNVSQWDVVVINRGERESIEVGDVLAIYRKGELVRDKITRELLELPAERAGLMMVFRTFEKVSYGLVLRATSSMAVLDEVRKP
ncbi:MAG TPA: LysM peptidoglycan-binding domain-containing protein [Pseudomonadales bacterium]